MLEFLGSGLLALWLENSGISQAFSLAQLSAIQEPISVLQVSQSEPTTQAIVEQYLKGLTAKGFNPDNQGVWIQSGQTLLASHQATTPLPAASITKAATSLAALHTWGTDHQFETLISATGPIQNGVVQGDLVIQGSGDPFFVGEEAIVLGNTLNQMGITQVTGNLVVVGRFYMNYETQPQTVGKLLIQALNAKLWTPEVNEQYSSLPPETPKPQILIKGRVQVAREAPNQQTLLIRHQSLPLGHLLRLMNLYSNNAMAEILAESLGGAKVVSAKAAQAAGVPQAEIQLINGSGLGPENRISPRAACALFMAIHHWLHPWPITQAESYTLADLFPVAGRSKGTIEDRKIPLNSVVKTGTLWDVSALAGVVPTRDRGLVWFAILNQGDNLDDFRRQQDQLLQALVRQSGVANPLPSAITPIAPPENERAGIGAVTRNQILRDPT